MADLSSEERAREATDTQDKILSSQSVTKSSKNRRGKI